MRLRTYLFLLSIVVVSLNLACKKSSNDSTQNRCAVTFANAIGKWKIEKVEIKQGSSFVDLTSTIEACQLDDYWDHKANKTYIRVDAGQTCNPPIIESGNWDVINGTPVVDGIVRQVEFFDCVRLRVLSTVQGITYRYTYLKI